VALHYLGSLSDGEWRALLTGHLNRADEFRVHMPDGDDYGRDEFLAVPGAVVRPWDGMRDAIEISGPLTPAVRDLFVRLEPSIESFDPDRKLWDYRIVQDGTVVLSIGDYDDLQVDVPSGD
jgi:hypothetical protein